MLTIGDQGDAVYALANGDFILRECFIANDTDGSSNHAERELRRHLSAGQLLDGFDGAGSGAGDDDKHNEDASQVFSPVVAVGVTMVGSAARESEGDPEGNGSEHIAGIVQSVGEESSAASDKGDSKLDDGDEQHTK